MNTNYKPPKAFFTHLKQEYARINYGSSGFKLEDYIIEQLLAASYGMTAWVLTRDGAQWIFEALGLEEIDLHPGFDYYYKDPNSQRQKIPHINLRIFRRCEPSIPEITAEALNIAKRVVYTEGWKLPEDSTFRLSFCTFRNWLKATDGYVWAKSRYQPLQYIEIYTPIAYRVKGDTGEAAWLDDEHVISDAKSLEVCECCDLSFPCLENYSGFGRLCNRCYADNLAEPQALQLCNRHECKEYDCQNYISDDRLTQIEASPSKLQPWRAHG